MATLKLGLLPKTRSGANEKEAVASLERRHVFSVTQEAVFVEMLRLERRRTDRSGKPFMLVLIDGCEVGGEVRSYVFHQAATAIAQCTRETDVLGWYERDKKLGLLMTEIGYGEAKDIDVIVQKLSKALQEAIHHDVYSRLKVIFRLCPDDVTEQDDAKIDEPDVVIYPDLESPRSHRRRGLALKRMLDIIGSLTAILLCLPVFLGVAVLVKFSSPGPVLFRQNRVGQYGRSFTFLKFRTMYTNNDPTIHQEYVSKLIAGNQEAGHGKAVYKLTNDPRVTPLGRFLRRSSLDELPQLFNVLCNDMSLVGPRPPLPYEYRSYQVWHRRRVLEVKPGMTGLWQVEGRSRTTFEEMVRMDLRYAGSRSTWMDLKILLQTPRAVVTGRGAC
jgi:lipopolysaccharide/colanic/teichoic acid biosynthesis glycosyltransferase